MVLKPGNRKLFELLTGFSCNANCRFCSVDHSKRSINSSTEDLIKRIYSAKKEGFRILGLGGGEPTIRKDLPVLIRYAKKINFDIVRIETNGMLLSNQEICDRLIDAGLDFVKMSVHSHKEKVHDFLTQVPGSFVKISKAIENLQKRLVKIEINTVLNRVNYKSCPDFVNFFGKRGIGSFVFIYPLYTGAMDKNWKKYGIRIKKIVPYLEKALKRIKKLELDSGLIMNLPRCCFSKKEYAWALTDTVPFNTKLSAPGITIENLDNNRLKDKDRIGKCRKCIYSSCEGIWKNYIKHYGKNEFKPIQ